MVRTVTSMREFSEEEYRDAIDNTMWEELENVDDHGTSTFSFVFQDYDGTRWIGTYQVSIQEGVITHEYDFPIMLEEAESYSYTTTGWRAIKDDV